MPTVVTTGAAYSTNKGAASMVQSLLDNLPDHVEGVRFVEVSTHPSGDRKAFAAAGIDVEVVSQTPKDIILVQAPLAFVAGLLRSMRLPWRWALRNRTLRTIADADAVADIFGISFADDRRTAMNIYTALAAWVPMLLGTKVVKCAQAMGPFKKPVNRLLAKLTLPRLARICPRGDLSEGFLRKLRLKNLTPAGDLAFTMRVPDATRTRMSERLAAHGPGPYLTVSPSQVVATHMERTDIDYPKIMAEFIDLVGERTGLRVVMIAHSALLNRGVSSLNDLPVCRQIAGLVSNQDNLIFFDDDLLPTELRAVIGESQALVASRFHAMISALTELVPPVVIGWSHKYAEVLAPFGIEDFALDYSELRDAGRIVTEVEKVLSERDALVARITDNLPEAQRRSTRNFEVLAHVLRAG
ncbi:MAG: polysaccharide pyruvyl transferase family protein [Actinomycetia bacterium]|nr:polysaccharide pyruvyl transferase family protein [Actinomycetes bacterium]